MKRSLQLRKSAQKKAKNVRRGRKRKFRLIVDIETSLPESIIRHAVVSKLMVELNRTAVSQTQKR